MSGTEQIANTERVFPFFTPLSKESKLTGFIMVEQEIFIDFPSRRAKRMERVNDEALSKGLSILDAGIY
jgi:hypothetical protein